MTRLLISFQDAPEGVLTEKDVAKIFGNPVSIVGVKEGLYKVVKNPRDGKKVLEITYPGGIIQENKTRVRLSFPKVNAATLTYSVLFADGFDFVRGGKLPGFGGGSAPRGGQKSDGSNGFSARIMWREGGEIFQYMYWMERAKEKRWGDNLPWIDLRGDKKPFRFIPDTWHMLKTTLVMNTAGERNGQVTSWFDGRLALSASGAFRAAGADFGIDQLLFTTFFGGNDLTWAPRKNEHIFFGDLEVVLE